MEIHNIHLDHIDSTQKYAQEYAKERASPFPKDRITCITAEEQSAARGRYQRKWVSPRGVNIYATFYFILPQDTLHLTALAHVMGFSCAEVLIAEGFHPKLKWPNDVLLHGKKVAGMLCETSFGKEGAEIFLGIGLNVNMNREDLLQIDQPATSLKEETGRSWDKGSILKKLQKQFSSNLEKFKKEGFFPFKEGFENLLAFKGETIRCFDGKKEWVGICHSLTQDGQLNLYMADRGIHTLLSGDILGRI